MDAPSAFTVHDGLQRGLTVTDLRRLPRPARGVRLDAADAPVDNALFEAVRALARPDQFFSHATAAKLHGMPLPLRVQQDATIHIASPSFRSRMRRPGIEGHRIKANVVDVLGLRVESVEDCFVHLATQLTVGELVAVGDWIVADDRPWSISAAELALHAEHFKGARHMGKVRTALMMIRKGAESVHESSTRLLARRAGLPEPALQCEVRDDRGAFVARLDLAWPEIKLALEYDGEQHRTSDKQYARDIERIRRLQSLGWTVIRVTKADFADGGTHIQQLLSDEFRRCSAAARNLRR